MNSYWQVESPCVKNRLRGLFNNELYSDFTFIILEDNVRIPAHKIIVSAASAVFERIACGRTNHFTPNTTAEVEGISSDSFLEILRYIYTDDLNLTEDNIIDIIKKTNYYGLSHLEVKCKEYLRGILRPTTVCWIYHQLFNEIYCEDLINECEAMIQGRPIDFFRSQEFVLCSIDVIKKVLKFDEIWCNEFQIFKYIIEWAKANCEISDIESIPKNWRKILDGADELIRFTTMTMNQFDECLSKADGFLTSGEIDEIKKCIRDGTPKQHTRFYYYKGMIVCYNIRYVKLFSHTYV